MVLVTCYSKTLSLKTFPVRPWSGDKTAAVDHPLEPQYCKQAVGEGLKMFVKTAIQ